MKLSDYGISISIKDFFLYCQYMPAYPSFDFEKDLLVGGKKAYIIKAELNPDISQTLYSDQTPADLNAYKALAQLSFYFVVVIGEADALEDSLCFEEIFFDIAAAEQYIKELDKSFYA